MAEQSADGTDVEDGIKKGVRKSTGGESYGFTKRKGRSRHSRGGSRFSAREFGTHRDDEIQEILPDDSPNKERLSAPGILPVPEETKNNTSHNSSFVDPGKPLAMAGRATMPAKRRDSDDEDDQNAILVGAALADEAPEVESQSDES